MAKTKHPTHRQGVVSQPKRAEQAENLRVKMIAEKASALSDPLSDIRNTDYWACKSK